MNFPEAFNQLIKTWREERNDRVKLQHAYLVVSVFALLLSGLISLIDVQVGRQIAKVAAVMIGIFLINAIVWALVYAWFIADNKVDEISPAAKTPSRSARK